MNSRRDVRSNAPSGGVGDELDPWDDSDVLVSMLLAELGPDAPSPELRRRLVCSVTTGVERFAPLVPAVAELLGVASETARALLGRIDEPAAWAASPCPGILFTSCADREPDGAIAGLLWQPSGVVFPRHEHLGEERLLVVEGSLEDDQGERWERGDGYVAPAGSCHAVRVPAGDRCIAAFVSRGIRAA